MYTEIVLGQNVETTETKKSVLKDVSKCQSTVSVVSKVAECSLFVSIRKRAFSLLPACYPSGSWTVLEDVKK